MSQKLQNATKNQETVFVFSAHSDDFVIGCGGTIAKYAKLGINVRCYVFSYGEKSHPWMAAAEVKKMRADECYAASEVLGCNPKIFDLMELSIRSDAKLKGTVKFLEKQVEKYRPSKIFVHSKEDPHPDHKDVHALSMQLIKRIDEKLIPDVYVYSVWNPFEFKTTYPSMFVDVKDNFETKLEAMRKFPSQTVHVIFPVFLLLFRGFKDGFFSGHKLAEKFFLVKTSSITAVTAVKKKIKLKEKRLK